MTPNEMKEARKKLNLTQKEFATKLGVKLRVVNYWEAGRIAF
jgi:DNA-binding transcriptional regulator YiaG